jgi:hypothetical protein
MFAMIVLLGRAVVPATAEAAARSLYAGVLCGIGVGSKSPAAPVKADQDVSQRHLEFARAI